ncbi:MAG TPA: response regulator [Rhizomicrobium sp.]|nr:response regulator [Rhizomicrobium sp.]
MKILFVEDDAVNRRVLKAMVEQAGSTLYEAEDALRGLDMIEHNSYDLVLMDLRMPGMDGMTAIRKIRERSDEKAKLPIIVVTADSAPGLRANCIAGGADDFIMKPVSMATLFDTIAKTMMAKGVAIAL